MAWDVNSESADGEEPERQYSVVQERSVSRLACEIWKKLTDIQRYYNGILHSSPPLDPRQAAIQREEIDNQIAASPAVLPTSPDTQVNSKYSSAQPVLDQ